MWWICCIFVIRLSSSKPEFQHMARQPNWKINEMEPNICRYDQLGVLFPVYATGDILSTSDGFSHFLHSLSLSIIQRKIFVRRKIVEFHIFRYQRMKKNYTYIKMWIKNKGHSLQCNELPRDWKNVLLFPAHCITPPPVLDARVVSVIHREYSHWRQLKLCYSAKREHEKKTDGHVYRIPVLITV